MTPDDAQVIADATRRRADRLGLLRVQEETREELRVDVLRYAALRQGEGTYTDTLRVELRDGTRVTAAITIDLTPEA